MVADRFPSLNRYDHDIQVYDETGNCAIYAKETKKGYSSVRLSYTDKSYSQMTAAEKAAAVEWVMNLPIEVVTYYYDDRRDFILRSYNVVGAYMAHLESQRNCFWYEAKKSRIISIERIY